MGGRRDGEEEEDDGELPGALCPLGGQVGEVEKGAEVEADRTGGGGGGVGAGAGVVRRTRQVGGDGSIHIAAFYRS